MQFFDDGRNIRQQRSRLDFDDQSMFSTASDTDGGMCSTEGFLLYSSLNCSQAV